MEFRKMRRARQQLPESECREVLARATSGVLSVMGDDGYPYGVPISYVADGDRLVFHSARTGHKIDAILANPKASFTVVDQDHVVPEEFTTYFKSVICFGQVRVIEEEGEKRAALEALGRRYWPDGAPEALAAEIKSGWKAVCVLELAIEHLTGKEAIELTRARG